MLNKEYPTKPYWCKIGEISPVPAVNEVVGCKHYLGTDGGREHSPLGDLGSKLVHLNSTKHPTQLQDRKSPAGKQLGAAVQVPPRPSESISADLKLCSDSWTSLLTEILGCVCCQAATRHRDGRAVLPVTFSSTHSWKRLLHFPASTLALHPCCQHEW